MTTSTRSSWHDEGRQDHHVSDPGRSRDRTPRRWPLFLIASPAAVAVWSGWVGLGGLCGFGVIHPLPGIWDGARLNTAITLPVGVEAYGAYALGAWLRPGTADRARTFARRSAIGALILGMAGQVIYHLLAAAHAARAPWPVVMLVACLPVVTLGFGAALTHLMHLPGDNSGQASALQPRTDEPRTDAEPPPAHTERTGGTEPPGAAADGPDATGPANDDEAAGPWPLPGADRAAIVAELAGEIRAAMDAGERWSPDYDALMRRTGFRRSWCEKAVRDARTDAFRMAVPAPATRTGTGPGDPARPPLAAVPAPPEISTDGQVPA